MNRKIFIIACLTLLLDQATKIILESHLLLKGSITIIKKLFKLTLVYNKGAAWGIFSNNKALLIITTILAIIITTSFIKTFKNNNRNNLAFGLLIGGMLGNLTDRLLYGHVRDFLDFKIFNYNYPIFNISDIAIVVSVILLIIAIIKGEDTDGDKSLTK